MIVLENIVLRLQGKRGIRMNDGIMSIGHGFLMILREMMTKGSLMLAYNYIYENWRIYVLPWDSIYTWIGAALATDLGYYWVHRAAHEVNFLWAAHQVHHSSEDYNLTTALRQSVMQGLGSWPFYLPMAFFFPPAQLAVHAQFNLLYQFWIHTELVDDLGPLEYILNTAKHHRVHHGSNRYCLDKNYAGVLIIWDRMFGTFEWERSGEEIVYGLVDQPQYFNPLIHQVGYYGKIVEKASSMATLGDKVSAFVKGPGWFPGTPRLGDPSGVPEIQKREKYDPMVDTGKSIYALAQFFLVFLAFDDLTRHNMDMSQSSFYAICGVIFWTLTSIGMIFDQSRWAWPSEFVRAAFLLFICTKFVGTSAKSIVPSPILTGSFVASMAVSTFEWYGSVKLAKKYE